MSFYTKDSYEWAKQHDQHKLSVHWTGRSIWWRPFMGGPGEVRRVGHVFCSSCTPDLKFPTYGAPIYEDELIELQESATVSPNETPPGAQT